jgi:Cu+-exporting ATPase
MSNCYHCGDDCGKSPLIFDEKPFCCSGCKTVYSILSDNGMDAYYQLQTNPGLKPKEANAKYAFLDNDDLVRELVNFKEGDLTNFTAFLPEIHCSSCIWLLENLHKLQPGVKSSQVNFTKKEATITFDHSVISLRKMAELMDAIGYPPTIGKSRQQQQKVINNQFIIQLGVAGFCFGNIMLFSFPEYLNVDDTFDEYRNFFAYLIFALSLPILFFSAKDYLISAYKALRAQVLNLDVPISLGILVLYAKSVYDIFMGYGPGYMDSFAGFIFFLLIGKWFQNKTYQALSFDRDYTSYFPLAVTRITADNLEEIVQIDKIQPGDELLIHNEEILTADAILLDDEARMDYSFVTGESDQIKKTAQSILFAGGKLIGKSVRVKVKEQVKRSYLTDLWNNEVFKREKSGLSKIQDTVSKYFLIVLLIVTSIIAGFWIYIDPSMVVPVVTAVLIVACPCALSLSYPFTFGNILRAIGRNGLYLKNTRVIEDLDEISAIVFDKTGTLTVGSSKDVTYDGIELDQTQLAMIDFATRSSTHPMSVAIRAYIQERYDYPTSSGAFQEYPGLGVEAIAHDNVLKIGSYRFVNTEKIDEETTSFIQWNNSIVGRFYIRQTFRPQVQDLIEQWQQKGYQLHVLTGDNERARESLEHLFNDHSLLNFNQSPQMKLDYIKSLQEQGNNVLMFGDGLNDAGALMQSNVGIAVSDNVYQFSPACDGILDAGHFNKLSQMLEISSFGKKALRICFLFSLLYNIVGLSFAATGLLSPLIAAILMPLSSITVVFLSFVLINAKAKRLGLM